MIVPAYNPRQTICQCLDSIVNQSYKNLEVIIIDDESTDNTLSICQQYAQNDSRVIALSQQNAGPSIARNRGLDIAKGEYVYFADCDDRLELNLVESMLIRLEETSTKMAFMQYRFIDETTGDELLENNKKRDSSK